MTAINRVTPEAKVIEAARVYAGLRYQVDHLGAHRTITERQDAGKLFDALVLAETHLLTAVKRLPQCLDAEAENQPAQPV